MPGHPDPEGVHEFFATGRTVASILGRFQVQSTLLFISIPQARQFLAQAPKPWQGNGNELQRSFAIGIKQVALTLRVALQRRSALGMRRDASGQRLRPRCRR